VAARRGFAPFGLHVRDAYVDGNGLLRVSAFGVLTLAEAPPSPAIAEGELMRFLAEAPWYPTALLPSPSLVWSAAGPDRALATLTDRGRSVEAQFRFDAAGDVSAVHAQARPYRTRRGYRQLAWEGRFFDHAVRQGLRVPERAAVGWIVDGTWQCVWRGRITAMRHAFVEGDGAA
jgi:hypothetical protein